MKNHKFMLTGILFFLFYIAGFTQNISQSEVSEDSLMTHVNFLASEELNGRGITTEGIHIAAEYLKNKLLQIKLSAPENGYLQPFTLTSISHNRDNSFLRSSQKGKINIFETNHFIAYNQFSPKVDLEGKLLFAGFGEISNLEGSNTDVSNSPEGKIVVYSAGTKQSYLDEISADWNSASEKRKMESFFQNGALAIIIVTNTYDTENEIYSRLAELYSREKFYSSENRSAENKNIFIVTPETANALFGSDTGWNSAIHAHVNEEKLDSALYKDITLQIHSELKQQEVITSNIFGYIEGTDPDLKEECIVFMSHYDHLGTGKDGVVFNGADDNASGVATLLEVANQLSSISDKLRRSILFLFPSAEETGLHGSGYYSNNPYFPLEKTIACINLDMVGRVFEPRDTVWNHSPKKAKDFDDIYALINNYNPFMKELVSENCALLGLTPDFSLTEKFFYTSDHYHFHRNKIPVINFSTGYTADYHKTTDVPEKIRTDKMKRVAELCLLIGLELANQHEPKRDKFKY